MGRRKCSDAYGRVTPPAKDIKKEGNVGINQIGIKKNLGKRKKTAWDKRKQRGKVTGKYPQGKSFYGRPSDNGVHVKNGHNNGESGSITISR